MRRKTHLIRYCIIASLCFFNLTLSATTKLPNESESVKIQQSKKQITGTVNDAQGPLVGVTVTVEGTTIGTMTDIDGRFTIEVPDKAVLKISYLGFTTQTITVGTQSTLDIVMLEDSEILDEVIVVGYGTQKKSDITGAMVNVKSDAILRAPVSNIATALQGLAAGVDVQMSGGNTHPGATSQIRIRGERSLVANNDPLIVVDGIPFGGKLNDISNDDIQSVSILKDASATAIYGSRGANGVVLITTKRGVSGAPRLSYSGYYGVVKAIKKYNLMGSNDFMRMKQWSNYFGNPNKYTGPDDPAMMTLNNLFRDQLEIDGWESGTNTNWQNLVFEDGMTTNHQVAVSGGNQSTTYNASIGYFKSENSYPGQVFERYSSKISLDSKINNWFKLGISSLNNYTENEGEGDNPTEHALRATPFVTPYNKDGELYTAMPGSGGQVWNPMLDRVSGAVKDLRRSIYSFTSGYAELTLPVGFKYRFNGGFQVKYETRGYFESSMTTKRKGDQNKAFSDHYLAKEYTLENVLTWDRTFNKVHNLNFTGLFSYQEWQRDGNSIESFDYFDPNIEFYNPGKAQGDIKGNGGYQKWGLLSYMARMNYNFKEKYLLTGTVRYDGSSRLAKGNQWHAFPSVAAGWNIMRENFMMDAKYISSLKLRASWGNVGSTAINPYQTMAKLGTNRYIFGGNGVMGIFPNSVPDYSLGWENTETINLGLDFGFLNNRINGTIEVYQQTTSDILLNVLLPVTSGYTEKYLTNMGEVRNRGFEFNVSTVNINGDGNQTLLWSTDFNIFFNRNKVTDLGKDVIQTGDFHLNQSKGIIRDHIYDGIWQDTETDRKLAATFGYNETTFKPLIGTIRVKNNHIDYEADGVTPLANQIINDDDKSFIGRRTPDFEGGINNKFALKGFDLSFLFTFRSGGTLTSKMHDGWMNQLDGTYNNLKLDYWTTENTGARWPKPSTKGVSYKGLLARYDASYLKLRNITFGYSVPKAFSSRYGIQSARFYTTASNLWTWMDSQYKKDGGIDPETSGTIDLHTPPTRSFIFGLNLTF